MESRHLLGAKNSDACSCCCSLRIRDLLRFYVRISTERPCCIRCYEELWWQISLSNYTRCGVYHPKCSTKFTWEKLILWHSQSIYSLVVCFETHNFIILIDFVFVCFFFSQICQALYFTLCVLNDLIGTNEHYPKRPSAIRKFKDYIFATFAFPLAMNVAISFWAIYAVDRELILPKSFESFFPK